MQKIKLIICSILINALPFYSIGQSVLELEKKAFTFYDKGNLDSTEVYIRQVVEILEKNNDYGKNLEDNMFFLGSIYYKKKQNIQAELSFRKAITLIAQRLGENALPTLEVKQHLGSFYFNTANYSDAKTVYTNILKYLKPLNANYYVNALDKLARINTILNNFEQSENYYNMLLIEKERIYQDTSSQYISTLYNMAFMYGKSGRDSIEESLYKKVVKISEISKGKESLEYAEGLLILGYFYAEKRKFDAAYPLYKTGLEIRKKNLGVFHKDYIIILSNLAGYYGEDRKYEEGEKLYLQVIDLKEKLNGNKNTDFVLSLNKLGVLYASAGQLAKAEKKFFAALEIQKELTSENSYEVSTIYNHLANLYINSGNYLKAEEYVLKTFEIKKHTLSFDDPKYADALTNLAKFYVNQNLLDKAEPLYLNALSIKEKTIGNRTDGYLITLRGLANLYNEKREFNQAKSLYLKEIQIRKEKGDSSSLNYINSIVSLADSYLASVKYSEAEVLYLKAIDLFDTKAYNKSADYLVALNNLGMLYQKINKFEKATKLFSQIVEKQERETLDYAISLENLAKNYKYLGQFDKAEKLFNDVIILKEKLVGTHHLQYCLTLNNLASVYQNQEKYLKSEMIYKKALMVGKEMENKPEALIATISSNLGVLYSIMGKNSETESCFLYALEIRKKLLGEKHPDYAFSLNNLASYYLSMGNHEKALEFCLKASQQRKQVLGENNLDYAASMNTLGTICIKMRDFVKADSFLKISMLIRKNILGNKSDEYAICLNNISNLFEKQGNLIKSEQFLLEALSIKKDVFGENSIEYASILNNLSLNYMYQGQYDKSEAMQLQNNKLIKKKFGNRHTNYVLSLNNLAALYHKKNDLEKTYGAVREVTNIMSEKILENFNYLSETEVMNYFKTLEANFNAYRSLYFNYKTPQTANDFYNLELSTKSMILKAQTKMRQIIANSEDSTTVAVFEDWQASKTMIAKQNSLSLEKRIPNLDSIEEHANQLGKDLTRRSAAFRKQQATLQIKWQDVQQKLQKDEAAIEFSAFPYFNGTTWTDSTMYVALLLRKDAKIPVLIPLFEEKSLDSLLQRHSDNDSEHISSLYQTDSPQSQKLYQLLWQPLEKSLSGVKKIYFSPSGKLHQIAFSALPQSKNTLLSDKYKLVQVNSTASLAEEKDTLSAPQSAVLFGGIDYNASEAQRSTIVKGFATSDATIAENRALPADLARGSNWNYLPGTKAEVEAIENIAKAKNITTTVFSRQAALEESFKRLAGKQSPDIIHVATHGFFFPDPKKDLNKRDFGLIDKERQPIFRRSDNPLYRGGLLFAGANQAWNSKESSENLEDGILTAYEVSNMYLPNTQLVVLSACETALGEIKGSEGVFGLQRAFQLSGARYLLMSLWKIPDAASAEFMKVFYQHYLGGKTVAEAFRFTQLFMRTKYKNEPYKWAAFVLIEG